MAEEIADKSWYKVGKPDIPVISDNPNRDVSPLSKHSSAVRGLGPVDKVMLYCQKEDFDAAAKKVLSVTQRRRHR